MAVLWVGIGACGPAPAGQSVRVLVYNIRAGTDAEGASNLAAVADLIVSQGADVVLLQEVDQGTDRSGGDDQPALLSDRTGLASVFGPTLDFQGGLYGIAIMSGWPVTADSVIRLEVAPPQVRAGGAYEPRGVLVASIVTPDGALDVLNTHLDPSSADRYRWQEIQAVRRAAESSHSDGRWAILGGDLNTVPGTRITGHLEAGGWRDAWSECGRGSGLTYPADQPVRRIDYLWLGPGVACTRARVVRASSSDHRPVVVDLILEPRLR